MTKQFPGLPDEEEEISSEELATFFKEYSAVMQQKEQRRYQQEITQFIETLGTLPDPKDFSRFTDTYPRKAKRAILNTLVEINQVDSEEEYLFTGMYQHYNLLYANMRNLLTEYEGMSCCMDKFRNIMHILHQRLVGVTSITTPAILPERELETWINMVIGLLRLANGTNDVYLESLQQLDAAYQK